MRTFYPLITALTLALSTTAFAKMEIQKVNLAPKVEVLQPWMTPQVKGRNSAVYFELVNHTKNPDKLLSASCSNCARVELHTHTVDNDVVHMQKVGFFEIPKNGNLNLEQRDAHLMCMGLNDTIREGETLQIALNFAHSGEVTVNVPVKASND